MKPPAATPAPGDAPAPLPRDVRSVARRAWALARAVARSVVRAFGLLWGTDRALTTLLGLLSLAAGVLPAAVAVVGKAIVDGVVRAIETGRPEDRRAVLWTVAVELGLVVVTAVVSRGYDVAQSILRVLLGQRVNEQIIEKALSLSLVDFENPTLYDKLSQAYKGASYRPLSLVAGLFGLARDVITLGAYGVLVVRASPWLALLIAVAAVPEFVVHTRFSADAFRLFRWRAPEARKQGYLESLLVSEPAVKEVRLLGLGPTLLGRYREIFTRTWREDRDLTLRRGFWGLLLGLLGQGAFYGAYAWTVWSAMTGRLSLGDLSMYLMVYRQAQGALVSVLHTVGGAYEDHLYLGTLFEFLDHPGAMPATGGASVGTKPGDGFRFEDVSFAYPGTEKAVLTGLNLHLPAGHKLALVGENGAGKTTLIKLLTRLYAPTAGRITLDGLDLAAWDQGALWRRIGVIFQDFVRYQFTVGENIGVGDVDALMDEDRWREAAERGMAQDFIDALPGKYQTQMGRWFTDGQDLSVGQWQKVALARAFMRTSADILVLDEPTASMDAEAEARVFERFRALAAERTAVLISHRFSTVRMADTIAVLAGGKVIEQGSHEELLARGGRYAELFFLQARGYR